MEAIFRDGGRQYKVQEGATVEVDYREVEPGSELEFADVLYLREEGTAAKIGSPSVAGARVLGTVLGHTKGPKLVVVHFRRRKNSKRRVGHRQKYTQVRIERIES